jgi:hypothetical protein
MELIDTITVQSQGRERLVMLFVGDLSRLPKQEAVDALIVSAFPDDYEPTPTSLIGALASAGVSVADLAKDKEVDLRSFSSCWLSRPIQQPGVHFRRLLCFEPAYRGEAPEVVGDIFRSVIPFTTGNPPISRVAMPAVASGDEGEPAEVMLEMLADASVHWLANGLPLESIKIVVRDSASLGALQETFARVKRRHAEAESTRQRPPCRFDAFVSYCQKNKAAVDDLVGEMKARRPGIRIFVDRLELRPGMAWQQHIFDSLCEARKVICVLSPDYLVSKVCKDEFNTAWIRHRDTVDEIMVPLYLYTADLPAYMKIFHYEDAREGDHAKIAQSAERLLARL